MPSAEADPEGGGDRPALALRPRRTRWSRCCARAATPSSPRSADAVINWARKYSMFLYPFVTACCGMEFMSVAGPRYDIDRFGCALPRFSPRQADLLMVVGTITHRQAPDPEEGLRPDGRAEVGDGVRRLHLLGRALQQLRDGAGHRHDHPGRHLHPRLPAAPRGGARRPDQAPGARAGREGAGAPAATGRPRSSRCARSSRSRSPDEAAARAPTMADRFDLAVIGAGPGGYVAAIRAAQLGLRVAVIEDDQPGGVCLNWGCIPSQGAAHRRRAGRDPDAPRRDLRRQRERAARSTTAKLIDHSRKTADRLAKGVESLFKKNQIELVARARPPRGPDARSTSKGADAQRRRGARTCCSRRARASGCRPGLAVDGERVLTSREALAAKRMPERLVVIGAGAVGVEFAYVYAMYGAKVTMVEMASQMLPGADPELAAGAPARVPPQGHRGAARHALRGARRRTGAGVRVAVASEKGSRGARGRPGARRDRPPRRSRRTSASRPRGVELDRSGLRRGGRARGARARPACSRSATSSGGALLAHKASEEGIAAVEFLAGARSAAARPRTPSRPASTRSRRSRGSGSPRREARDALRRRPARRALPVHGVGQGARRGALGGLREDPRRAALRADRGRARGRRTARPS